MTEEEHSWLEYQEYAFAGLVLVPKQSLIKYTNERTKKTKDRGISMGKNRDFAWELITEHVAKAFPVSPWMLLKNGWRRMGLRRSIANDVCK